VRRAAGDAFRVRLPGPGILHTDGEVRPASALVEVRVRPRSLRVLVAPGREG
jgi:diacylglycerol kinase family enzyme